MSRRFDESRRPEGERWTAALDPVASYTAPSEAAASQSEQAHRRRDQADLHDQQLQRDLGHDRDEDLDAGVGV